MPPSSLRPFPVGGKILIISKPFCFGLEANSAMLLQAEQPTKSQKKHFHLTSICYNLIFDVLDITHISNSGGVLQRASFFKSVYIAIDKLMEVPTI